MPRILTLAALAAAVIGGSAAVAAPAVAEEPWGFEMVTPPEKGGGAVNSGDTFSASPDGNSLLYSTTAPFEGVGAHGAPMYVRYFGTRGPSGWSSRSADVHDRPNATFQPFWIQSLLGTSSNLEYALVSSSVALTPGATNEASNIYMQHLPTGSLQLVATSEDPFLTRVLTGLQGAGSAKYVASDGQSALFVSPVPLTPGAPPRGFSSYVLYSWRAGEGVRAVSVMPESEGGATTIVASVGTNDSESGPRETAPREWRLDRMYFTAFPDNVIGGVYLRTGNETRAVSVSRIPGAPAAPAPAELDSIASGGRYALFHTRQLSTRLTEDTPEDLAATFLYRYDAENDSLAYVGAIDQMWGPRVVQMSQDGQTIAFQSALALTEDAEAGRLNMYVWRNGTLRFVAAAETSFPASHATDGGRFLRLLSPSGRYLSFTDNTPALAQRMGFDNVSARCPAPFVGTPAGCDQVYLFDADTARLTCVSCRRDGLPARGHAGDPSIAESGWIRIDGHQMRTVTDEGTVFFNSPDDLVAEDANGMDDAYRWSDGALRLLSRGKPGVRARFIDSSRDGRTVFIATDDPIVSSDVDRAVDIYMTRPGAGFPQDAPVRPTPCAASDCRAPVPPAPALPAIGSLTFVESGDGPKADEAGRAALKVGRTRTVTSTRATVPVRVSGPGLIGVAGSGVKSSRQTAARAATYAVSVALDRRSVRRLATRGRMTIRVVISFKPKTGESVRRAIAVTFRRAAPGPKQGRGRRTAAPGSRTSTRGR